MSEKTEQEICPSVPCSRNLRRRTGIFMGVEATEFFWIACLSMIPDILHRIGVLEKAHILAGLLISALSFGFVVLFKHGKQRNYFTLWLHHHFLHPKEGWRAPRAQIEDHWPILEDKGIASPTKTDHDL